MSGTCRGYTARRFHAAQGLAVGLAAFFAATAVYGQEPEPTPAGPAPTGSEGPRRVLQVYDFDEADNPDPVPASWQRTTLDPQGKPRPGFPKFNLALLDNTVAHSGKTSIKLPTSGGCTALRLRPGETPVFADADYAVAAFVRTAGLEHARAFLTARLLDQHLQVIAGSEVRSAPVITGGLWQPVSVRVPGRREGAAWLQIDLELLQERQYAEPTPDEPSARALAQHKVWREDVRGAAWFDDVNILQIPQATLTTASPRNIVVGDEPPTLVLTVRDLGGDSLKARVRVRDLAGKVVAETVTPIDPGGRPVTWTPALPGYGWFSANMDVLIQPRAGDTNGKETEVSRGETRFIRIPGRSVVAAVAPLESPASVALSRTRSAGGASEGLDDAARFGLIAERTPDDRVDDLPELTRRLGTGFIYLPAWHDDSTPQSAAASLNQRRSAIEGLLGAGQVVTLSLPGLPTALARSARVPVDDALSLSGVKVKDWFPYLAPTLDIFGQRLLRYQIGASTDDHAFWKTDLAGDLSKLDAALSGMVPGPIISIPWSGDRDWSTIGPAIAGVRDASGSRNPALDALTVRFPSFFPPSAIRDMLADYLPTSGQPGPELTTIIDLPVDERFGGWVRVTELSRRIIEFWNAGNIPTSATPPRLAIEQPWVWGDEASSQIWPNPEAAVLVNLAGRLSGRRIVGEVRGVAGVKCYVLAARNAALGTLERGALVAWNQSADPAQASVEAAAVGSSLTVVDVFGNQSVIAQASESSGAGAASPLINVRVGETPLFIEGVDPYLALFAASFRLEPGFMPAVVREHEHRIVLTNPWPVRITGKLQLKEDSERAKAGRPVMDEWRVSPSGIIDFDMAPGQTLAIPVTLSFGPGQLAGTKDFFIVARAMADRAYPPVRLKTSIEVGLEDIDLDPELQPPTPQSPRDVVVIAAITNKGTRHRTLRLETAAKNMPSQQLQISDLPPGQTVLRRFVFKDAASELSGRRVVISLSDLEEAQRLNKAVQVP